MLAALMRQAWIDLSGLRYACCRDHLWHSRCGAGRGFSSGGRDSSGIGLCSGGGGGGNLGLGGIEPPLQLWQLLFRPGLVAGDRATLPVQLCCGRHLAKVRSKLSFTPPALCQLLLQRRNLLCCPVDAACTGADSVDVM